MSFRDELGVENCIIFKGPQVVIPSSLQKDILSQLHKAHQGIEKTRLLARESVFWQNVTKDITKMIQACEACQETRPANHSEPLTPHKIPSTPWKKLGTDLFEIDGVTYLISADYFSKFPVTVEINKASSSTVTMETKKTLALSGKPDVIVSDNGLQFIDKPYQDFTASWEIQHVTSSPHYPKSNGFIEGKVQTIENTIQKRQRSGQDVQLALLQLRATPVCNNLPSPAEVLMKRKLATTLPSRTEPAPEQQREELAERCEKMTRDYNRHAGTQLSPLHQGQPVWAMDHETRKWKPATVIRIRHKPHSYVVALDKAPPSEETEWTSGQEPNHPPTLMINLRHRVGNMEMVISATHKTIGHQAQTATWTDKGRLLKIKVKRRPCN